MIKEAMTLNMMTFKNQRKIIIINKISPSLGKISFQVRNKLVRKRLKR